MISEEKFQKRRAPDGPGSRNGAADRQQYTLKGVEVEAVELMRLAAETKGMKIGHWVSDRLKEAAKTALHNSGREQEVLRSLVGNDDNCRLRTFALEEGSMSRPELEERVRRLELEVQDLLRSQRDLLATVVGKLL